MHRESKKQSSADRKKTGGRRGNNPSSGEPEKSEGKTPTIRSGQNNGKSEKPGNQPKPITDFSLLRQEHAREEQGSKNRVRPREA